MTRLLACCRVCLAYDTRLCSIVDGQLREIYEILVEASLDTGDMLPTSVCYICYSVMKKMLQFRDRSQKANQILQQMISTGLEPSVSSLDILVKDQTGISWTLGISDLEWTTTTSGEVEFKVKTESVESEMDIDRMSDCNEDYSDSMPVRRDSTSDSENDLPLQNISEQCKSDRANVKIENTHNVRLKKSGREGAAPPENRKLDNNATENELVNIQGPLRNIEKDEEPREKQEERRKKIPSFKKRSKNKSSHLKTILKGTKTNTSNIMILQQNDCAFNKNYAVTPPNDIFTCDLCKNEYQCKMLLESHLKKSHVIELNRKDSISSDLNVTNKFKTTNLLELQEIQNNDNRKENSRRVNKNRDNTSQYDCQHCMKRFSSNSTFTKHLKVHTKSKPFKCDICEKGFYFSSQLTIHLRVHTKERPFKCDICEKGFSKKSDLTRHLRVHTKEKPFKCHLCEKGFSQSPHLTCHLRAHSKEKPFRCDICEKNFSDRSYLTKHLTVHTKEKPFKCDVCEKEFSFSSALTTHLTVHNKEKPFKCDICEKGFSGKAVLTRHLRVHTKEKPFKCHSCEKGFSQSPHLTNHLRVHSKEKPFKCDICEKGFPQSHHLTNHLRFHTKEKPFKCDICEKCFSRRDTLTKHLRVHSKEKPFRCDM